MNLLNEASDSKFVTRKLNISNDQSNANYDVGSKIIHNTEIQVHSCLNDGNISWCTTWDLVLLMECGIYFRKMGEISETLC